MANSGSWVLLFAFLPLLIVEDQLIQQQHRRGGVAFFLYALLSFLTWNILSTWWIAYVSVGGMLIINFINAFLMACVWWIAHSIRRRLDSLTGYCSMIVFWLSFEYLHFNWSMQWPWLTLGNGFAPAVKWIQWIEFTGVLGSSLWLLLVNVLLYAALKSLNKGISKQSFYLAVVLSLLIVLPLSGSIYRYHTYSESNKRIQVAVLQPNIDPYKDKFSGMTYEEQLQRLVSLAINIVNDSTKYVVAPETALEPLWENDSLRKQKSFRMLDSLLAEYRGLAVIAGALTQRNIKENEPVSYAVRRSDKGDIFEVYNTALYIDYSPNVQIGHKNILVSGVEKIPFQEYFSWLGNLTLNAGGVGGSLASANQPTVFRGARGEGIGSVICFESAFGGFVASSVKKGANILFVITNDGWWKSSAGLTQHFNYSSLRAVETRRSIARSANTGLSGFISEKGDMIKVANSNSATAISASLTLNDYQTFYVRHGDYLGWISAVLAGMIVLYLLRRRN